MFSTLATRARDLVVRVIIDVVRRMYLVVQRHPRPLDLVLDEVQAVDHGLDVVIKSRADVCQVMDPLRDRPDAERLGEGVGEGAAVLPQ